MCGREASLGPGLLGNATGALPGSLWSVGCFSLLSLLEGSTFTSSSQDHLGLLEPLSSHKERQKSLEVYVLPGQL